MVYCCYTFITHFLKLIRVFFSRISFHWLKSFLRKSLFKNLLRTDTRSQRRFSFIVKATRFIVQRSMLMSFHQLVFPHMSVLQLLVWALLYSLTIFDTAALIQVFFVSDLYNSYFINEAKLVSYAT